MLPDNVVLRECLELLEGFIVLSLLNQHDRPLPPVLRALSP
ncbi:hypothetical protein [Salinibacter altiplanensis]|nr:hypothetical protein [Salinibacter altiplanensis]